MGTPIPLTILDRIPLRVDVAQLLAGDATGLGEAFGEDVRCLAQEAEAVARPKGLYQLADVEHSGDAAVSIGGISFASRVLAVNLEQSQRVFPFLATCGVELDAWADRLTDPMQQLWADRIKELALHTAITTLDRDLAARYAPGKRAMMNPGSLEDWPVSQQRPLFSVFGDAAAAIGVILNASFTMSPIKSVSGLWFETEEGFQSCALCPREGCPKRRAPYDAHLFDAKYRP